MSDLLDSLLRPLSSQPSQSLGHQSSNESFHSTTSQTRPRHAVSKLAVRDVDEYLNDPANAAMLVDTTKGQKRHVTHDMMNLSSDTDPIPLESRSSGFVSALHETCQGKGLPTPTYQFDQTGEGNFAEFRGTIQIGDLELKDGKVYRSKKAAKEGLSELALPQVKNMPARRHQEQHAPGSNEGSMLWIQLLNEYCIPNASAPKYQTFALGLQFSVVLTLGLFPDQEFGSKNKPFASKKDAQTAAAKEAVLFLMREGHLDENGRPIKRKAMANSSPNPQKKSGVSSHGALRLASSDEGSRFIEVPNSMTSIPQRTSELALLLGLTPPTYSLSPISPQATAIHNGHAVIGNAAESGLPGLTGPIGSVESVYGKANAKVEIAGQVWTLLVQAARSRGFEIREVGL